eukprot:10530650-Alexandrium_andersonii.AAC.1
MLAAIATATAFGISISILAMRSMASDAVQVHILFQPVYRQRVARAQYCAMHLFPFMPVSVFSTTAVISSLATTSTISSATPAFP